MKSIIQLKKVCYLCGANSPLHLHHCLSGSARKKCDEDKLTIYLCPSCHRLVHDNYENLLLLKRVAQRKYEEVIGTREQFIKRYGKNYLC